MSDYLRKIDSKNSNGATSALKNGTCTTLLNGTALFDMPCTSSYVDYNHTTDLYDDYNLHPLKINVNELRISTTSASNTNSSYTPAVVSLRRPSTSPSLKEEPKASPTYNDIANTNYDIFSQFTTTQSFFYIVVLDLCLVYIVYFLYTTTY